MKLESKIIAIVVSLIMIIGCCAGCGSTTSETTSSSSSSSEPYLEPIDILFEAYNNNDLTLLEKAVTEELYETWDKEVITDEVSDDSYTVEDVEHPDYDPEFKEDFNASDLYIVTIKETIYCKETDSYDDTVIDKVIVGCVNGTWKICGFMIE